MYAPGQIPFQNFPPRLVPKSPKVKRIPREEYSMFLEPFLGGRYYRSLRIVEYVRKKMAGAKDMSASGY